MPFSTLPIFGLNRDWLPFRLGVLRLIAILATIATLAQWFVPVGARFLVNCGRVYYSNECLSQERSLLPWPVLSVPAWLTITTGLIAIGCASAYLLLGRLEIADDIAYMTFVPLLAGYSTIYIAAFEKDPTGIFWTPGPEGYPMGWHWIVAPFGLVLITSGIIAAVRMKRLRTERRRKRALRMTEG